MNKVCRVIKSILLRFDIFGVPMKVTLFNKAEKRTCYGTLLTVILVGFLAGKTISLLIEMATRQDFESKLLEIPDMNTPLQLNNFTLYLCPADQGNMGKWSFGAFSNFNFGSSEQILPYNCSLTKLDTQFEGIFNNCMCYDMAPHRLTDSNTLSNLTLSIGSLSLNEQSEGESDTGSSDMCMFYLKSYVIAQDYYNPVQSKQQMHLLQSISGKFISVDFSVENIMVYRENDYSFGFETSKQEMRDNITTVSSVRVQTSKVNSLGGLVTIQFIHSGWMRKYVFNGFDGDKFFSTLGGYYEIWIWFFSLIGSFINSRSLRGDIRKQLNTTQGKSVLIELNHIKQREMLQRDIENIKTEQHPGRASPQAKKDTESSLKSSQQSIIKPIDVSFKINTIKKKEDKLLKKPTLDKKPFSPVKQFEEYLDLEKVYSIIKEVKLLEVLCLNQKTAPVFFNCRRCEIDLPKLDSITKETALSLESQYLMDSFNNKLDIIHSAIVNPSQIKEKSTIKTLKRCLGKCCNKKEGQQEHEMSQ